MADKCLHGWTRYVADDKVCVKCGFVVERRTHWFKSFTHSALKFLATNNAHLSTDDYQFVYDMEHKNDLTVAEIKRIYELDKNVRIKTVPKRSGRRRYGRDD